MSDNVCGSGCERFTALAIHDGGAGTQAQGTWNMDPDDAPICIETIDMIISFIVPPSFVKKR